MAKIEKSGMPPKEEPMKLCSLNPIKRQERK
jgi:hypothetical protein